jgi:hypothetical protein
VLLLNGEVNEYRGWFRFLTEHHFPFDVLTTDAAMVLPWNRYRVVVIPNLVAMDDGLAAKVDQFVHDGGTALVVGQSGFRNGDDEVCEHLVLRCVGITGVKQVRPDMRSSYFKLDDKTQFDRFAATDLIYLDGPYVYADYAGDVVGRFRLIPPHMFGPPERCYYTQVTDHPCFTVRTYGKGKAIYVPWLPGRLFHRQGYVNTFDFVGDLLSGVAGLAPIGEVLSPMVEVTRFEKADGQTQVIHLVNGSGHFGVSFFAPVVMADLNVVVPMNQTPKTVRGLVCGQDLAFDVTDGKMTVRVPRLDLFEAIVVTI